MASIDNVRSRLVLYAKRSELLPIRLWGMMESTLESPLSRHLGLFGLALSSC